jgi:hypothetical protein
MPEPFNGRLDRKPKAIMLALNPGNAFMGEERWMGRQPMPDLHSRRGKFAQQIKEARGSYTKWARNRFDWPALNDGSLHPFVTSRMRFVNDWISEDTIEPDEVVWFDLYPWQHSKSWSSPLFSPVRHFSLSQAVAATDSRSKPRTSGFCHSYTITQLTECVRPGSSRALSSGWRI